MNIQLQNPAFFPHLGGAQWIVAQMAKELLRRGHQVSVLCQSDDGLPERDQWRDIQVVRHSYREPAGRAWVVEPWMDLQALTKRLPRYGAAGQALWPIHETYALASARVFPKSPLLYIVQHNTSRMTGLNWQVSRFSSRVGKRLVQHQRAWIQREALQAASAVVTWCEMTKFDMVRCFGVDPNKVHVVLPGPGIDPERITQPQAGDRSLRHCLGLPDEARIVLCCCRLVPSKNVAMLLRAMPHVHDPHAYLVIVGGGPQQPALEQLARELGVASRVRFAGSHANVSPFYAAADLFVFPSIFEGFGIVLLEAMLMELACIGLQPDYPRVVTATEEVIVDGQTGFCVSPYSVKEMADRIDTVLSDEPLRRRMGEAGRRRCLERFRWDRHIDRLLEITRGMREGLQ